MTTACLPSEKGTGVQLLQYYI